MTKRINAIFIIELMIVALIAVGILPRQFSLYLTLGLAVYFLAAPIDELALFFVRSIPLFIAMPLTSNLDSLNSWRIFSIILFLRWLNFDTFKNLFKFRMGLTWFRSRPVQSSIFILLILALFSISQAVSYTLAVRRLFFLVNLGLIGIVIYDLTKENAFGQKIVANAAIPVILAAIIGLVQLASTYFMNIFQFVDFWGDIVERNLFGNTWADIAVKANTWFAYFGDQLSLRMFSIFPDSHSFPIFLILGAPAILAYSLAKIVNHGGTLKEMIHTRANILIVFFALTMFEVILSGTRGMWAAGIAAVFAAMALIYYMRKSNQPAAKVTAFRYISSYLAVFFILFALAYPVFASPQFQVAKEKGGALTKRVRSIVDFGETSNSRRLEIWKDSLISIIRRPLLGVGIGNFPVVVNEDLAKAKAGSSAHNLYLHIAAEMGLPALLAVLYLFWLLLKKCYRNFLAEKDPVMAVYFGASLIFIPWNFFYFVTDIAIFDERAFLLFIATMAVIFSTKNSLFT